MRTKGSTALVLFFLGTTLSCTTVSQQGSSPITLSNVEQIALNSTMDEIEKKVGKPSQVVAISNSPDKLGWVYLDEQGRDRVTLVFGKKSRTLGAKTWRIKEGDPEKDIQTALKRYPNAHFKKREAEIVNPHIAPDEYYYEDPSLFISIEVRFTRNEVSRVSWFLPEFAPKARKCNKFQTDIGFTSCKPD